MTEAHQRILVTGGTGYVGGRLIRRLLEANHRVRCLARRPDHLKTRLDNGAEVVRGDVLDRDSLAEGLAEIRTAYYLVHSMGDEGSFEELERRGAENFGRGAAKAGIERIIYLGGLGSGSDLSPHLRSRQEVGQLLHSAGVPVIEFRASIVIGSGSLSFEMIRALVERLPVMITPRWVSTRAQPIAITDLLDYLFSALDSEVDGHQIIEVGGADQVSYGDLMREYALQRRLRRTMIPVPVLSPRLSSLWLGLVTPLYARTGRKLVESLRHPTVVHDHSAESLFPGIRPRGFAQAVTEALRNEDQEFAETRWSDSLSSSGRHVSHRRKRAGNRLVDQRSRYVEASPETVFRVVRAIGGKKGWYYGNWLWRLRGFLDLLVGGVGIRRGRRDPNDLHIGDVIDWWRVESYDERSRLRLAAEMRLPGRAWLDFTVRPEGKGAVLTQTALFDPLGLAGVLYWYGIYPVHTLVFKGMINGIAQEAEETTRRPERHSESVSSDQ